MVIRVVSEKKYALASSTEPRLGKVLSAIHKLDRARPKRKRIPRVYTDPLESFEAGLKRKLKEFKNNKAVM